MTLQIPWNVIASAAAKVDSALELCLSPGSLGNRA